MIIGAMASGLLLRTLRKTFKHMHGEKDMNSQQSKKTGAGMEVKPYQRLVSMPIHSENIFHFPEGLPAFETVREFVFLMKPDTQPFMFMHSIQPPDLVFVCIDPFLVCPDYQPRISDADTSFLHLKQPEDVLVLAIVTVRKDVRETTANLQAPIIINMQTSLGKQIICEGQHYEMRYKIWEALDRITSDSKSKKEARMMPAGSQR